MSFVINNFDDAGKWKEVTIGTGAIQNRTADSFEAVVSASGDRAGLVTPVKHNVSELADLRVYTNRNCAISSLGLIYEEIEDPTDRGFGMAIVRDTAYGVIVWFAGGAKVIQADPIPADGQAELRITITEVTEGYQASFYYNGELIYQDIIPGSMGTDFYVKLGVSADRGSTVETGTTTFASTGYVSPLSISISPSTPQVITTEQSILFTANVSGGSSPYTIDWYVNGEKVGTGAEFVFTSSIEGEFTVYAIVTDSEGTTAQSNVTPVTVEKVSPPPPPSEAEVLSEIRGAFVHSFSFNNPDWDLIAETCKNYGINTLIVEGGTGYRLEEDAIAGAVSAAHAHGLKIYVSLDVLIWPHDAHRDMWCVDDKGEPYNWACPTKQVTRDSVKAIVEKLATYDIDGFMFDYIRYDTQYICYCDECKQAFEEYLGETITDWSDFAPGGSRWYEFLYWRLIPVTKLVDDIRKWMLAIKPDLKFALAAWTYFQDCPIYWRKFIGQDTGDWIRKDCLDWVAPMMYTQKLTGSDSITDYVQSDQKYMTGGIEGKIPLVAFLCNMKDGYTQPVDPSLFKQEVDLIRSLGVDGFCIWRYGGPGDGEGSNAPDIRNYLSILDMPPVFAITDVTISATETQATISWKTSSPASSLIEYSPTPLFTAVFDEWGGFKYWKIVHNEGSIIRDDTPKTEHSITITGLSPSTKYYFRVQGQDASGIATSKVFTFNTIGVSSLIKGKVIDEKTLEPIPSAAVSADSYSTLTGDDGTFTLEVPPGVYTITIEKAGYLKIEIPDVDASEDVTFTEPVKLTPTPPFMCFIATVAYGSPLASELNVLRRFRDRCLPNQLVSFYYKVGPYLAQFIKGRKAIKHYVRTVLNLFVKLYRRG